MKSKSASADEAGRPPAHKASRLLSPFNWRGVFCPLFQPSKLFFPPTNHIVHESSRRPPSLYRVVAQYLHRIFSPTYAFCASRAPSSRQPLQLEIQPTPRLQNLLHPLSPLTMSVLAPELHAELLQLLDVLKATDNTVRAQAEEHLNSSWLANKPELLLMGLVEQIHTSSDKGVSNSSLHRFPRHLC